MGFQTEVLKRSPLWAISFIFNDMRSFAYKIGDQLSHLNTSSEDVVRPDLHIRQIVQHLTDTTRCLLNYSYVNDCSLNALDVEHESHLQAIATWDIVTAFRDDTFHDDLNLLERYSDRAYMYCLLLWNCAEQILQNKGDVFNDTIDDFISRMPNFSDADIKFYDERTQPLFKLISQIGNFHIFK
jgi:hypothetical protein